MKKTMIALWAISLAYAITVKSAEYELAAQLVPRTPSRSCCGFSPSPTEYMPLESHQEAHAMQDADTGIVCAVKGEKSLMGSSMVSLSENEAFFYGFHAPTEDVSNHLKTTLPEKIKQLASKDKDDLHNEIADMMNNIMIDFLQHREVDAWDLKNQDISITFLHMNGRDICPLGFHCTDKGNFEHINGDPYYTIDSTKERLSTFLILAKRSQSELNSSAYNLVRKNKIAWKAMYKQPDKLAQKIMETDTNDQIKGCILLKGKQWLESCQCPSTTDTYKALKQKWNTTCNPRIDRRLTIWAPLPVHSIITVSNKIEKKILEHRYDSAEEFVTFAQALQKHYQKKEKVSPEVRASLLFVDDMIKQKQTEEASSVIARVANVLAILCKSCGSR